MQRTAYIECNSGVSGDMLLGALLSLGVPLVDMNGIVTACGLGGVAVSREDVSRGGVSAVRAIVTEPGNSPARDWAAVQTLIGNSRLDDEMKSRCLSAFQRLAEAEAAIHGVPVEKIHFHELSGADTVVDVACAIYGFRSLGIEKIVCSPINTGSGTVKCEHGILPVPAPATAELLRGVPVFARGDGELTTPTGALLVTALASSFGPLPAMTLEKSGCGAGSRDTEGAPNVVRVFIGTSDESARMCHAHGDTVLLQTNIDDMNPQIFPYMIEKLLSAGALDAWVEPCIMKKGRPGFVFTALVNPDGIESAFKVIVNESTTLGVRVSTAGRMCVDRKFIKAATMYGEISVKIGIHDGNVVNVMPEYEDCAAAARASGAPLSAVMQEARAVALKMISSGGNKDV